MVILFKVCSPVGEHSFIPPTLLLDPVSARAEAQPSGLSHSAQPNDPSQVRWTALDGGGKEQKQQH